MCAVQITVNNQPITLPVVYCSPSYKIDSVDFNIVFQQFSSKWIIEGNYNVKNHLWSSRTITSRGRQLAYILHCCQYQMLSNGEPTY